LDAHIFTDAIPQQKSLPRELMTPASLTITVRDQQQGFILLYTGWLRRSEHAL
jgi:hypothetical protein